MKQTIGKFLRISFINGLLTILPFSLTLGLFMLSFRILINWLRPAQEFIAQPIVFLANIPYKEIASQLFLALLGIILIGAVIKVLLLEPLIHALERMIFKIPLVRPLYSGIKQLVHAFSAQDKVTFKKVVLVEFPRNGLYSIGFLTNEFPQTIASLSQEKLFNIFIPTTPNPTTGFLIILPESAIREIDLTRQEAMAMIISGGIIQPERF